MRWRAVLLAVCIVPIYVGAANAQFQPVQPAQPQQEPPPCVQEFLKLREVAEKKAAAIKMASEHKASAREVCPLFGALLAAQTKMLNYANDKGVWCGIPPNVAGQIKQGVAKISEIRTRVCQAASAPAAQAPSLSDALSSPIPDSNNIKTGRGTFDTLTGTPLGK
jgi:hypothetical protein